MNHKEWRDEPLTHGDLYDIIIVVKDNMAERMMHAIETFGRNSPITRPLLFTQKAVVATLEDIAEQLSRRKS